MGSLSLLQGIFPTQGSNSGNPTLQVDSLPAEPQVKSKNTGMGSLSLLQGIFQTQKSNRGLLHHRQILYWLNYEESPNWIENIRTAWSVFLTWPSSTTLLILLVLNLLCWFFLFFPDFQRWRPRGSVFGPPLFSYTLSSVIFLEHQIHMTDWLFDLGSLNLTLPRQNSSPQSPPNLSNLLTHPSSIFTAALTKILTVILDSSFS